MQGDRLALRIPVHARKLTSFMLGLDHVAPRADIEASLAALHDGRRGFMVSDDQDPNSVMISVGDQVFLSG